MNHLIIDGFNLAYRSNFAFKTFTTSVGMPTGCVYGFMTGLKSLKLKYPDYHVTIAWDMGNNRRKAMDSGYKADRPKFESPDQINTLKNIYKHVNVSQAECIGEEADDTMATLVKRYKDTGLVIMYTNDKDMLQLVEDGKVLVLRPKRGKIPEALYDEEAVKKDKGVTPKEYRVYLSLRGDAIDGIPGIPSVPDKCLIRLIERHKDIYGIYANLESEELTQFQYKTIKENEERVNLNTKLVSLIDDLEPTIIDGIPNTEELDKYLKMHEFKKMNADAYIKSFIDASVSIKTAPALESYSIFDEEN